MKIFKLIGLAAFFVALGMLIMLFMTSRLMGLFLIAILLLLGYCCLCCDL
ncbi:MAG: hypothetical protein J6B43_12150 [Lachnospiraceae bacterium]|nr:hypothetical protein [Lachnospiraceae bacterium]